MSTQGWEAASFMLQLPAYVLALVLCFFILPRGKYVTSLDDVPADKAWPKGFSDRNRSSHFRKGPHESTRYDHRD